MNWYKQAQQVILLSPAETDWVDWALGDMYDHWCTEDGAYYRDGELYDEDKLPQLNGNVFIMSPIFEIMEDILYRLETQAEACSQTDANSNQQAAARCRSAFTAAAKIRDIL